MNEERINQSGNPLFPGWYADPEARIFQDRYWIYPTYSAPYEMQTFFDAFYSTDLTEWTKAERILKMEDITWASKALWAPSPVERNGKFYYYFAANDIQSDDELGGIGVAVADQPEGPFRDAIGKPLIDRFHFGAQPIDPHVFLDDDGCAYLYYGGWGHCNVAKLSEDMVHLDTFADGTMFKEITPEHYIEGPCMFKRHGVYYFMWSEGGWTGPDYSVAYAMSDSPVGPFQRVGKILQQDPDIATGAGHHGFLQIPDSDEWYIVYHRRPLSETDANHRVVCMDRMLFEEDGRIQPVQMTHEGVAARPLRR
ncbi:MAG: glycoside hydrolase family 43 protein [Paenibacillaceae bacterium]|uniref:Glycoside hydrolase family 43 protein n=1 Tax=Paenibacillus mellifer TaxID=2937794 RepID=A0A9X1XXS7_9BACL|nr:glycoside hydrolase family 43 protein [Paenibacillus mellifer]MBW4839995.1 glycoside hydrolase family 43 protein [Paenibacillaceae bacterium]MCK8487560.1 glycoside hydrolase family 43 protein [Paenibacillus mellifer]